MTIQGRRAFASVVVGAIVAFTAYLIIGSLVRDYDEGIVTENKYWVEKDGNGYINYNKITIKRADGSLMQYDNQDDMIIWKRNSDKFRAALPEGVKVKLEVNLHRNITAIIPVTNNVETTSHDD